MPITLFCNPYLAEIFSYRFDVLTLTAALSLSLIYPCIRINRPWLKFIAGTVCLMAIYCLYQTVMNIALMMTLVTFYLQMSHNRTAKDILLSLGGRMMEFSAASVIYLKIILAATFSNRHEANHPVLAEGALFTTVKENAIAYQHFIAETLVKNHSGAGLLIVIMLVMWLAALVLAVRFVRQQSGGAACAVVIIALLAPLAALLLIPGSLLLLQNPTLTARAMIADSGFMLTAAAVVSFALKGRTIALLWLLFIPLIHSLTTWYAYGNALRQQTQFDQNLVQEIKHDTRELNPDSVYILFNGERPRSPVYLNALRNHPVLSVLLPNYFANWYWPFPHMQLNGLSQRWPQTGTGVDMQANHYLCQSKPYASNQDYVIYRRDNVLIIDFTKATCEPGR